MTLATRISALFCILSIIPLSVVGYLAYNDGRAALKQITINSLMSINMLKQSHLEEWISSNVREVKELAQHALISDSAIKLVSETSVSPEFISAHDKILQDYFLPTLKEEGGFSCFYLLRARDGRVLVSTNKGEEGSYMKIEPYYDNQTGQLHIQDSYYRVDSKMTIMNIGASILDRQGNLIAIVGGHGDLKELTTLMRQTGGANASNETYLVDESQTCITPCMDGGADADLQAVQSEGIIACLKQKNGVGLYNNYRGEPVIGAHHWIPQWSLCILTEESQAEAYASISTLRNTVILVGISAAMLAALAGLFFARTITGPVRSLVKGTEEIGKGNLDYRISLRGGEELEQLASALNVMAGQRRDSEEALRESEKRFRAVYENAGIGIALVNPVGLITESNYAFRKMFGYNGGELKDKPFNELVYSLDETLNEDQFKDLLGGDVELFADEKRFVRKDGEVIWGRLTASLISDVHNNPSLGVLLLENVTKRKKAEEMLRASQETTKAMLNATLDPALLLDINGKILAINTAALNLYGKSPREMINRNILDFITFDFSKEKKKLLLETVRARKGVRFENELNGNIYDVNAYPIADDLGRIERFAVFTHDITAIKQAEEQIRASLREKEILLKEIHHRVKNNMQVIISLLRLQSRAIDEPRIKDIFEEAQSRVRAMALIHQVLFQSGDISRIDLKSYVKGLADSLFKAHKTSPAQVALEMDAEEIEIGIDLVSPCGLVLNELISNCFKYAFPEGRSGEIKVEAHAVGVDEVTIAVSDNGVGLPRGFDIRAINTTGLSLVLTLVEYQLKGRWKLSGNDGTSFSFTFKNSPYQERL